MTNKKMIRTLKSFYDESVNFEQFIREEFSDELDRFVMMNEYSCNECIEIEDIEKSQDSALSFSVKFKAFNKLSPNRILESGLTSVIFPVKADAKYNYTPNENPYFISIGDNHYDLIPLDEKSFKQCLKEIYEDHKKRILISTKEFEDYLINSFDQGDWLCFLQNKEAKNWKNFIFMRLRKNFENDFMCTFEKKSLQESALKFGEKFILRLRSINQLKEFSGSEAHEIKLAFGNEFLSK